MEKTVTISAGAVTLEGRLAPGAAACGAVITHPHPLYGGSQDNNVVWTAARAFQNRGCTTLRFNFRGVGLSTGAYGDGVGEVADVAAALAYLQALAPGPYHLVGYSFGASVSARAMVQGLQADAVWLISPPIAFMDLHFLPQVPRVHLIVVGDRDELCPLESLKGLLASGSAPGQPAAPEVVVIKGADHFFGGREEELFQVLREYPWPGGEG
jgi:alpha/beta superfamily hydrolase